MHAFTGYKENDPLPGTCYEEPENKHERIQEICLVGQNSIELYEIIYG